MNSVNVFIPSVKKDKIVNDKEIGKRFKKKRLLENITFQVNKECLSFLTLELVETLSDLSGSNSKTKSGIFNQCT